MTSRILAALVLIAALALSGCAAAKPATSTGHAAEKLTSMGDGRTEVALTPEVAANIGVRTEPVVAGPNGPLVATSAIVYRPDGTSWVYTEVRPHAYLRAAVVVVDDTGPLTTLASGPAVGMPVVVQGASLVYGTEFKIGK